MKTSLLEYSKQHPDLPMLFNKDERLGMSVMCSYNELKKIMDGYEITDEEILDYDVIESEEDWILS